jgi:hypothetical protein
MFQRITTHILDITKQKKSNKVAIQTLKFFLASDNQQSSVVTSSHQGGSLGQTRASNYDLEPSKDPGNDTSPEELTLIRSGARKVLTSFQASISEVL